MKIVIQCAGKKDVHAGRMQTREGKSVMFVADPQSAPNSTDRQYAKPDDRSDNGESWRARLLAYNAKHESSGHNPFNLLPAWKLYNRSVYGNLVEKLGVDNVYIHSAGWGIIPARFLTPDYDITYSPSANGPDAYKRRKRRDVYDDFCMLPLNSNDRVLFFGGKDYFKEYCKLTENYVGERICFYNSSVAPDVEGVTPVKYLTTTKTNWHYECVKKFLDGKISLSHTNA